MVKKLLFILISTLYIYSCTTTDYVINVKVEDAALNGTTVFLKERINREWNTIDSAVISNQTFEFKGIADTAKIAYLTYEFPEKNLVRQEFVLENAKITVNIDSTGFMVFSGSKQNVLLQNYQNDKNVVYTAEEKNYLAQKDSTVSKEQKVSLEKEMEDLYAQEVKIDKSYATTNINTLVGNHIFMNSFYGMTVSEKESVISLMNDDTRNIKRISEIVADVETEKKVAVGQLYTDFKLPALEGDSLSISDLVGKSDYLLIDFWASWCGPCIRSLPDLTELYNKYKGTRFQILGVSLDEDKNAWVGAIQSHNLSWKHVSDLKGWKSKGSRTYAVNSIPSTVLINKEGKIIGRNLSLSEIENFLTKKDSTKELN
ncbi:MAG: TlpA disulfide reductase family protein [Paludibacter sp.]|nr:TlpA disulfide reductase family protein [Paludibacter sp.]